MADLVGLVQNIATSLQQNSPYLLQVIGVMYFIHFINFLLHYRLNVFGILPRTAHGLIGIPCAPFLHGNFNHLFFNSIPLFLLANFVMINGIQMFYAVTVFIVLVSGLGIWIFGRPAFHIGASALIVGYWGYLLFNAIEQQSTMALVLGFVCLYYFAGLAFSVVPTKARESWEGHLCGLLAGLLAAYLGPYVLWVLD